MARTGDAAVRGLLGITAFCHAAGGVAYALSQPRGFSVPSAAFFEHQVLGPLVVVLALVLGVALVTRREKLGAAVTAALAGFWFVVAAFGLFTGTTAYARLLVFPFAAAFLLAALAHQMHRRAIVIVIPALAGALVGAGVWASARAPRASTFPSKNAPKSGTVPEGEPALGKGELRVRVEGTSVIVEAGMHRAEIVPSFDYDAVADGCGLTVLDHRAARRPPFRAGREGARIVFAGENADFEVFGEVEILGASTVRIEVSTTLRRELCAHLGSIVAMRLSRVRGSDDGRELQTASINGFSWPSGEAGEPAHFVAFRGDELGFFRATHDEKGPFTAIGKIDEPVITDGGFHIRVPSWKEQASREPSPTAGWGISQGAIEHYGDWFFWHIAATSIGRGWHTVRTAKGTYETTILLETR
ncbi:hypothetical protein [Polyangium mundeleinium]|uniref:Uncharacterized protein n=1 Tax=Polyangium mundeleinium TaxID=2995306 RepID=A0ABT5ERU8_9BACT|nr:hypothetical protein [Polyangium mundeleinium]MDC0744501.1 hypothetical protein [Polyangium mundeleinium]